MDFFDDIDTLARLFWNIENSKTASKNYLTQFSLHYRKLYELIKAGVYFLRVLLTGLQNTNINLNLKIFFIIYILCKTTN